MDLREVDLRRQDKAAIGPDEIPVNTERLLLSYNDLRTIEFSFFFSHFALWEIDVSHNQLTTLSFLRCFRALGRVDISSNSLAVDDLLDLRRTVIIRISLSDNPFDDVCSQFPLFVPTILSHAWVINDWFVTDAERAVQRDYESSLEFGSILIASRKHRGPTPIHLSPAQAGKLIMRDHDFELDRGVEFTPARGDLVRKIDAQTQFDRLSYLTLVFPFPLPDGAFQDYLGVGVGLLGKLWIDEPLDTIPHFVCPAYWFGLRMM
jgi:hypothetical protein